MPKCPECWRCSYSVLMVLIYRLVEVQGGEQEAAMNCGTLATVTRENDAAQQPTHWW